MSLSREDRIAGVLLGTAVGDAIGLPREGLSRARAAKLFGPAPLGHALVHGRGMVSDDTEHTVMVATALIRHQNDPGAFARSLAWQLRWWLLRLPAGIGWATLRATVRLWVGFPPERSGVGSAGNGPAMRSAVLGVCVDDEQLLRELVLASTRLTHRHPEAEDGALAVAVAARCAVSSPGPLTPEDVLAALRSHVSEPRLLESLDRIERLLACGASGADLARELGLERGVTGYICHTVPIALMCWLASPGDFRRAVEETIELGGDTDTTGAIVGALAGASVGVNGIPGEWLEGLWDWPLSRGRLASMAAALAADAGSSQRRETARLARVFWPGYLVRNPLFAAIVLAHGVRRLAPPY